ncbi:MAG TPA: TatD family hydrolase [Nitrospiria bacterium]|nr:TatD family hydrolase [Nitrospiria bacterium]
MAPSPIIDSHAHLQFDDFTADLEAVLGRAQDAGVTVIVNVGTDLASSRSAVGLADRYPQLYATVGLHPHEAATFTDELVTALAELARHPKVVAIGETGLDYYYQHASREAQMTAFRAQLELARAVDRPVVVHSREAKEETLRLLAEAAPGRRGVLHCFTGDLDMAQRAIGMGFYISLSGIVTFKNAGPLRDVAKALPLESLLIETDCPYLTPTPYRGARNEPAFVVRVIDQLTELTSAASSDAVRAATRRNTVSLFGLDER